MQELFLEIFYKVIPLYFSILLGYIGGRFVRVKRADITRLVFYMLTPLIVFNGVLYTPLSVAVLTLPLATYVVSCLLALLFYWISSFIWKDNSKNILAYTAGSGNTGYFGLPLAIMLFDNVGEGIYIVGLMGLALYESTLGFYLLAKGRFRTKDSLIKVLTLPTVHAFILGIILNSLGVTFGTMFHDFMDQIKGAYTILGMMVIGLGIAALKTFRIDWKFIGVSFIAKFVAWPIAAFTIIALDRLVFGIFDPVMYQALLLLSIVPLSVNTVIVATLLDAQPNKAATSVMLSTLFAMFYVPLMVVLFIR